MKSCPKYPPKCIFLALALWLIASSALPAQASAEQWFEVSVKEGSIRVNGATNVNEFHCSLAEEKATEALKVALFQNNRHLHFSHLHLDFAVRGFQCGIPGMSADLCKLLRAERYPQIELEIINIRIHENRSTMNEVKVETTALLKLAGQEKKLTISNSQVHNLPDSAMLLLGSFAVKLTDFGLEPPVKMLGMVKVEDQIRIDYRVLIEAIPWHN